MDIQNGSLVEAGVSERSGAPRSDFHDAERSGETPASAPVEGGLEVVPRKRRNRGRAEQVRILREYDGLAHGEKGLFLRQNGLRTTQICAWRKLQDERFIANAPKRGRKAKPVNPLAKELAEKERHLKKALKRLEFLEQVIEVQKKISEITGIPLKVIDFDEND
jgi:transposase